MTTVFSALRRLTLVASTALVCIASVQAASPNALTQAQERYRKDIAKCINGDSNQNVATCRREAGSALAEAKRSTLQTNSTQYQSNALKRCEVHEGDDRVACEARINYQGDVTIGAEAGGLLRKSITVKPAQ